jgi:hypothetical protein
VRVFLYSLLGIPLLIIDGVLLYVLTPRLAECLTPAQGLVLLGGGLGYVAVRLLVRKPERMYLWGHELTHLVVAKLFLREVHGFHITSRSGGKVVINRTNVAIDLAPYAVPLYNVLVFIPATMLRGSYPHGADAYLGAASFLFTMHLHFSAEGFIDGQPDVKRSGRLFSAASVLFAWMLFVPLLATPGIQRIEMSGLPKFYREWIFAGVDAVHRLLMYGRALL